MSKLPNVTLADLTRERVERGLSWKQVAINLNLGSTYAARHAWRLLTGTAPTEAQPVNPVRKRRSTGLGAVSGVNGPRATLTPIWNDDSDQDEIYGRINGADITVQRTLKGMELPLETFHVGRVVKFAFDGKEEDGPLVIHFYEPQRSKDEKGKWYFGETARVVRVRDIRMVS